MNVGVRLPAIDQYGSGVGQRTNSIADGKLRIRTLNLQQDVSVRMGMTH